MTATDLNAAMVEFGSRQAPGAEWRQADALGLPFDDDRFDLVACQFGVMFFPDKPAAFAEVRRVLAPGGALLLTTWGDVGTHGFAAALARVFDLEPPQAVCLAPTASPPTGFARGEFSLHTRSIRRALGIGLPMLVEGLERLRAQHDEGFDRRFSRGKRFAANKVA